MAKTDIDISALSTNVENIGKRLDRFTDYMEKYIDKGDTFREETTKILAVIVNNQGDFRAYTKQCDADRNQHDKRLTACEGFQGRFLKMAGAVGAFIAFIVTGTIEWFRQ